MDGFELVTADIYDDKYTIRVRFKRVVMRNVQSVFLEN